MATRKPNAPHQPDSKGRESEVPEGFDEIELDMPSVHWEETSEVRCTVIDSDMYLTPKATKRVLIVMLDGQPTRLYEQPGLRRLFDKVQIGDELYARTTGKRDLGGGHTLRLFKGGMRPGVKRTPIKWPSVPVAPKAPNRGGDFPDEDIPF